MKKIFKKVFIALLVSVLFGGCVKYYDNPISNIEIDKIKGKRWFTRDNTYDVHVTMLQKHKYSALQMVHATAVWGKKNGYKYLSIALVGSDNFQYLRQTTLKYTGNDANYVISKLWERQNDLPHIYGKELLFKDENGELLDKGVNRYVWTVDFSKEQPLEYFALSIDEILEVIKQRGKGMMDNHIISELNIFHEKDETKKTLILDFIQALDTNIN